MQFQRNRMIQTQENDKKPHFGWDLGPFGPPFFFFFFLNLASVTDARTDGRTDRRTRVIRASKI